MSFSDDVHPKNKGKARAAFDQNANPEKAQIKKKVDAIKAEAKFGAVKKVAERDRKNSEPKQTLKPTDPNLKQSGFELGRAGANQEIIRAQNNLAEQRKKEIFAKLKKDKERGDRER